MGKHKTGQVRFLERGKYQIRVQSGKVGEKRRGVSKIIYGKKSDADEALKDLLDAIEQAEQSHSAPKTVNDLLDEYLYIHRSKVREQTYNLYVRLCEYIREYLGTIPVDDLTPLDIEKFLTALSNRPVNGRVGFSAEMIRKIYTQLKAAISKAVLWDWIIKNPTASVRPPRPVKNDKAIFTLEELEQFFAACTESERVQWMFFVLTGCRPQEGLAARWSDIRDNTFHVSQALVNLTGKVKFGKPKNDSSTRTIPIDPELIDLLKQHKIAQNAHRLQLGKGWHDHDLIFPTETGDPQRLSKIGGKVTKICVRAGITKNITPHSFRHTFATLSLAAGVNIKVLSDILGHANILITASVYLHPDKNEKEKASKIITNLILKSA